MPSFTSQQLADQEEKRERDPADMSGAKEPNWDDPDSWGGGNDSEDDSASGKAGDTDSGNDRQDVNDRKPAESVHRPARRRGRPRGPDRAMLSVRILAENDRTLTAAVEETGLNPQTIVDQALMAHFKRLKIQDPEPGGKDGTA